MHVGKYGIRNRGILNSNPDIYNYGLYLYILGLNDESPCEGGSVDVYQAHMSSIFFAYF